MSSDKQVTPAKLAEWVSRSRVYCAGRPDAVGMRVAIVALADARDAMAAENARLRHAEARAQERVDMLAEETVKLRDVNARLVALLQTVEWSGTDGIGGPLCIVCRLPRPVGHHEDCALLAEIKGGA